MRTIEEILKEIESYSGRESIGGFTIATELSLANKLTILRAELDVAIMHETIEINHSLRINNG